MPQPKTQIDKKIEIELDRDELEWLLSDSRAVCICIIEGHHLMVVIKIKGENGD